MFNPDYEPDRENEADARALGEALCRELLADGVPDAPLYMADAVLCDMERLLAGETDLRNWSESEREDALSATTDARHMLARVRTLLAPARAKLTEADRADLSSATPEDRASVPF